MGASQRIELFWDIYSCWYDSLSKFEPYRTMLADIIDNADVKKGNMTLDLGCGTGALTKKIGERGAKVIGLDNSFYMLKKTRLKINSGTNNIRLLRGDINTFLSFKDGVFDRICASNVISYSLDPAFTLSEMYRILKCDGTIIVTNPKKKFNILRLFFIQLNKKDLLKTIIILPSLIILGLMNIFIFKNVKCGRYNFFNENDIAKIVTGANFKILKIIPTYGNQAFLVLAKKG